MTATTWANETEQVAEAIDELSLAGLTFTAHDVWTKVGRSFHPSCSKVERVIAAMRRGGLIEVTNPGRKPHAYRERVAS